MNYPFRVVVDRVVKGKAYPALTQWQAEPYTQAWRQFGQHWPNTVPVELHEHCTTHNYPIEFYSVDDCPDNSFYTIGLGFFNFSIDYIELLPTKVFEAVQHGRIRLLFYYHEGDNPNNIKLHLDILCNKHQLPPNCYCFVSGNTSAEHLSNFVYFPDHELLYWHRNRHVSPAVIHNKKRNYKFTVLNRTHKWWRATAMADLWRHGILTNSQWSYNQHIDCGDQEHDNPIEIDSMKNLRRDMHRFFEECPHTCDHLTAEQHNDHHLHVEQHYTDSYCSIILETHYDADASGGSFLTEKTFKCLKHGHPFVIVGPPGSLKTLRDLGYRTFDHAIDNSYDLETNNTRRWNLVRQTIKQLAAQDLHTWFEQVRNDVEHNQRLFLRCKQDRLNILNFKLGQI